MKNVVKCHPDGDDCILAGGLDPKVFNGKLEPPAMKNHLPEGHEFFIIFQTPKMSGVPALFSRLFGFSPFGFWMLLRFAFLDAWKSQHVTDSIVSQW